MTIEDDLRVTLRGHADAAVLRPDLLDAVRSGVRRDRHRRTAVAAALAATVMALGAAGYAVTHDPVRRDEVTVEPTPSSRFQWERPQLASPVFPLTPGWTPPDARRPHVERVGPDVRLVFEQGSLLVTVGAAAPQWDWEAATTGPTTVNGRTATIRAGDDDEPGIKLAGISWQLPDKRWVGVFRRSHDASAEARRFAQGLTLRDLPTTPLPFTVATAPLGYVLQSVGPESMSLAPAAVAARDRMMASGIMIDLPKTAELEPPDPAARAATVGGRPATVFGGPSSWEVWVDLGGGRTLRVSVASEQDRFSRADMLRFTAGVAPVG